MTTIRLHSFFSQKNVALLLSWLFISIIIFIIDGDQSITHKQHS